MNNKYMVKIRKHKKSNRNPRSKPLSRKNTHDDDTPLLISINSRKQPSLSNEREDMSHVKKIIDDMFHPMNNMEHSLERSTPVHFYNFPSLRSGESPNRHDPFIPSQKPVVFETVENWKIARRSPNDGQMNFLQSATKENYVEKDGVPMMHTKIVVKNENGVETIQKYVYPRNETTHVFREPAKHPSIRSSESLNDLTVLAEAMSKPNADKWKITERSPTKKNPTIPVKTFSNHKIKHKRKIKTQKHQPKSKK
jgi:hypothetical protein